MSCPDFEKLYMARKATGIPLPDWLIAEKTRRQKVAADPARLRRNLAQMKYDTAKAAAKKTAPAAPVVEPLQLARKPHHSWGTKRVSEVKPEPVPEVKPEPVPEVKPVYVPEVKPEPVPEPKPAPAPEVKPAFVPPRPYLLPFAPYVAPKPEPVPVPAVPVPVPPQIDYRHTLNNLTGLLRPIDDTNKLVRATMNAAYHADPESFVIGSTFASMIMVNWNIKLSSTHSVSCKIQITGHKQSHRFKISRVSLKYFDETYEWAY